MPYTSDAVREDHCMLFTVIHVESRRDENKWSSSPILGSTHFEIHGGHLGHFVSTPTFRMNYSDLDKLPRLSFVVASRASCQWRYHKQYKELLLKLNLQFS